MLTKDILHETYFALTANKGRSVLTILGIVIGIGSVIAMVSIGQGAQQSITNRIESNGANVLTVSPGKQRSFGPVMNAQGSATSLTMNDYEAIESIANISAMSPLNSSSYQVAAKGSNSNTSISGIYPDYQLVKDLTIENGDFINNTQLSSAAKVAVLGATVATDLFGEDVDPIGQSIRINSMNFKVIGVLSETGSGFNSSDDAIFVPFSVLQRYFTGGDSLSSINIKATSQKDMAQVQDDITNLLMEKHNITDSDYADFSVRSSETMMEMASSVTSTLTILLGSIAAISLIVGGIGIMNMMLTSVTERTREIGLRKAIGAKSKDISIQFLAESVMLTFVGGICGIVIGWLASYLVEKFASTNTAITWQSIALSFGVSVAIGIIFGYYPARRAAKLNPIDALRYE